VAVALVTVSGPPAVSDAMPIDASKHTPYLSMR
jgi:hypothetical protein